MDDHTLLVIMAVFVFVSAVALVIQAGTLFGLYKAARSMQAQVERLTPKVEALTESSRAAIDDSRAKIAAITTKANEILDTTHTQLKRVDELMAEASERTRRQFDHAELVLDDAIARVQQVVIAMHSGVMKPIREISGIAAGIRAAIYFLRRSGRPSPDRVTVDEEMFI